MRRQVMLLMLFILGLVGCSAPVTATLPPPTPLTATEATPTPTPTPQNITPTPRATITLASYPTATPICPDALPTRLILQERGWVLNDDPRPLNIRAGPGTEWRILRRLDPREIFIVIEGPTCTEQYVWYKIRYRAIEGWIAEGDANSYYVEPYLPG